MRLLSVLVVLFIAFGCGESKPRTAEASVFEEANSVIDSKKNAVFNGNSAEAKEMAGVFSENIETMQKLMFEGGKKNRIVSLTGEKFLTYCQANEDAVVFLVHVPQFKRYKDEVRDALLELSWKVAELTAAEYKTGKKIEIAIGLRGSVLYGGSAIGKRGATPKFENSFSVDTDKFHKYFKVSAAPAKK